MGSRHFTAKRPCAHCGKIFFLSASTQWHCSLACRFWSKVQIGDENSCWLWKGARQPRGYGLILHLGTVQLANRIAWLLTYRELPALNVLHHCDNPPCVNPRHLFLGTHQDNALDRESKGRGGGKKFRGKLHYCVVLREQQIPKIRALLAVGTPYRKIGALFGVTYGAIAAIAARRAWHYVQ